MICPRLYVPVVGAVALLSGCLPAQVGAQAAGSAEVQHLDVTVREGTNLIGVLAPDGDRIAFILLGKVWLVDRAGGEATALTDPATDLAEYWRLAWSPDGRRLMLQRSADTSGVFVVHPASGEMSWVSPRRDVEPVWHPSSGRVALASHAGGSTVVVEFDPGGRELGRVATVPGRATGFAFAPDGAALLFASVHAEPGEPASHRNLQELDLAGGQVRLIAADTTLDGTPAYSPDGRWIAFLSARSGTRQVWAVPRSGGEPRPVTTDVEDVYEGPLSWTPDARGVLYTAAGKLRIALLDGGVEEVVEFAATLTVARWHGLRRPEITPPGSVQRVRGIVTPELSPDGRRIAFAALGDVWILDVDGGAPENVTRTGGVDEMMPRWSPDGRRLAYVSVAPGSNAELRVHDLAGTAPPRVLPIAVDDFNFRFAWSPDGESMAFTDRATVGRLDLRSGATRIIASDGTLSDLVGWTPDGEGIVYETSRRSGALTTGNPPRWQLWHASAADSGRIAEWLPAIDKPGAGTWTHDFSGVAFTTHGFGEVRRAADAPSVDTLAQPAPRDFSWSADGRRLAFLSLGTLHVLERGGEARALDLALEYRTPAAPPPLLIRGARVIDGSGTPPTGRADVLLSDGRVAAITPAGSLPPPTGARVIDANGLTVMPGLFNLHAHVSGQQAAFAAFVYHGVLAVRNLGPDGPGLGPWRLSARERQEAGHILAPRMFLSAQHFNADHGGWGLGEEEAMGREVARRVAEGADVIKVRWRNAPWDARASAAAHTRGVPMTSHYIFPSTLAHGLEGKEHSHLYYRGWTALYRDDVLSLWRAANTCVTPTLLGYPANVLGGRSALMPLDSTSMQAGGSVALYSPATLAAAREWLERPPLAARALSDWERHFGWDLENMRRLRDAGIRIATGTDLPSPLEESGVHLEMELLVHGGLTPLEAIRAATLDAAHCLGVEHEIGSIEPGKLADLIIVSGDPALDIRDTRNIEWVILGGRAFTRAEIVARRP